MKTRVIILFGGRSAEHEISWLSARNILRALDRQRFEPVLVGIDKTGVWRAETEEKLLAAQGDPRALGLRASGAALDVPAYPAEVTETPRAILQADDVVFPVLHGTYGEDGKVQGLLEMAGVAYVGSGPLGSGIGMDKDVSKRLLAASHVPVVPWRLIRAAAHEREPERALVDVEPLGYPLFVKPANAGSSVGVSKVKDPGALKSALASAFRFDEKVLVEAAIDAREIECAVLGNDQPEASMPGEIVVTHADGFYSYAAKYVDPDGAHIEIPAQLPDAAIARVRELSLQAFTALELAGMARVDFFVDRRTMAVYLNEVNTIPGFTAISMYPKMWEAAGLSQQTLVTRLIDLARERHARRKRLLTEI
jgi:D-alanine-D-alanine ligase